LEEEDARELVERPVADFPAIYGPGVVEAILALTHRQPFLVQLVCGLVVELLNRDRRQPPEGLAMVEDVQAVMPVAFERAASYFDDQWRTQTGSEVARRVLRGLARAAGEGAIRTLLRREMIAEEGEEYRVAIPLFAAYVRRQVVL
jgi:uncharacterized protein